MVGAAPCVRKTVLGALEAPDRRKKPSHRMLRWLWHYAGEILKDFVTSRIADQLSPYHDSQFSAFSTEVLVRKNRDTIAVVLPVLP